MLPLELENLQKVYFYNFNYLMIMNTIFETIEQLLDAMKELKFEAIQNPDAEQWLKVCI